MPTRTIFAFAAAAALASLAACGLTGPAHDPPPPGVAARVTMGLADFRAKTVTIRAGETVQWRNTSPIGHTVTADPARAANPANVALPAGAQPFHSGEVDAGQVWSHTFTVPGTYRYVCLPHERQGMVGTVIVER